MPALAATFGFIDWTVLAAYFLVLAVTGAVFARRTNRDTDDYFLGGRRMPTWAVAVSVLATSLSAATFIGGPQQSYVGNLTYLSTNLGMILAALVIAVWFIPAFYRARVSTVYELLETRFGPGAKQATSAAFMVGRLFAGGARLYIVALPAALIIFGEPAPGTVTPEWQLLIAIGAMTLVGVVYTLVGGIASVIWSDVIQTGVFLAAVVGAIVLLLVRIPVGPAEITNALASSSLPDGSSKLTLLSLSFDPAQPYTLWTVLIGFTLLGIASYGTDQDLVQRMLTCKTAKGGAWSVIAAQLMGIPVVLLFLVAGLLLFVFYQQPQLMGDAVPPNAPDDSRTVFLNFILREMPAGMSGLMMAGLFAAGLSSLNSALNAMASTTISDFYAAWKPDRPARTKLVMSRVAVAAWGLLLGVFACLCVYWQRHSGQTLIDFALGVMAFAYAGLLGVYFTALFTKRGSTWSVIAALLVGFGAVAVLRSQPIAFPWQLTIAATLAFGTCLLGNTRHGASERAPSAAR